MRLLLLFIPVLAFGQGTPLPGPLSALPDASGNATGVCGWNKTQLKQSCFTAGTNNTSNWNLQALDAGYSFDNSLFPSINRGQGLGFVAAEWVQLHVQNIYNYGPNPFTAYSDIAQMVADTGCSGCPISFLTHNIHRGQFDDSGFMLDTMAGSGTRCAQVTSGGYFSPFSAGCGAPISNLNNQCSVVNPLTGAYQVLCTQTATTTGTWLIYAGIQMQVGTTASSSALFALAVNGTVQTPPTNPYGSLTQAGMAGTPIVAATISQMWTATLNSGDVVTIQGLLVAGTALANGGVLSMTYLHP